MQWFKKGKDFIISAILWVRNSGSLARHPSVRCGADGGADAPNGSARLAPWRSRLGGWAHSSTNQNTFAWPLTQGTQNSLHELLGPREQQKPQSLL